MKKTIVLGALFIASCNYIPGNTADKSLKDSDIEAACACFSSIQYDDPYKNDRFRLCELQMDSLIEYYDAGSSQRVEVLDRVTPCMEKARKKTEEKKE